MAMSALPPIADITADIGLSAKCHKQTWIGLPRSPEKGVGYWYRRPCPIVVEGLAMKLPRRKFLHLAAGAAALPAVSRVAWAQAYPSRPVRMIVGFARWRRGRHHRAPDRPMAVGAARPAIRHREPAGRRQQYRHRGGRACAAGRLHAPPGQSGERDQRDALRQAQFQFHPRHRAGRGHHPRAQRHGGESIGSGQDGSRVHRLCQGQSGQDQHGVGRHRDRAPCGRRAVQDDDRRRHGARALSRRRRPRSPICSADRCRSCSAPCPRRSSTSGPASCARWR